MERNIQIIKGGVIYERLKSYDDFFSWNVVGIDEESLSVGDVLKFEDKIDGEMVVGIGPSLNIPKDIKVIHLGKYIDEIDSTALENSEAKIVILGSAIRDITFVCCCDTIEKLVAPESNPYFKNIGDNLYSTDGEELIWATNEEIDSNIKEIGPLAFFKKSYRSIKIPKQVQDIKSNTFFECKIDEIVIGKTVKNINFAGFNECTIGRMIFEEKDFLSHLYMNSYAVKMCNIKELEFVKHIHFTKNSIQLMSVNSITIRGGVYSNSAIKIINPESLNFIYVDKQECIMVETGVVVNSILGSSMSKLLSAHKRIVNLVKIDGKWTESLYW